jgi:hypothetical protein
MFALTSGLRSALKIGVNISKRHISFANVNPVKEFTMNNQQIEYGKFPSCVDCIYFNSSHSYVERGICLKYGTKNVVTGVVSYEEAKLHRGHNSTTCSIEGDGFAKKDQPECSGCP